MKKDKLQELKRKLVNLTKNYEYKQTNKIKETVNKIKEIEDIKQAKEYLLEKIDITWQWGEQGQINIEFTGAVHACCHMNIGMRQKSNGYRIL